MVFQLAKQVFCQHIKLDNLLEIEFVLPSTLLGNVADVRKYIYDFYLGVGLLHSRRYVPKSSQPIYSMVLSLKK